MISTDQQQASRDNGKKSHGPKTPEGKAVSSLNAVKYGFFARDPLLPGECADAFAAFRSRLTASLAPAGEMETLLVGRIVNAAWRLRRFPQIEAEILTSQMWSDVVKQSRHYAVELLDCLPVKAHEAPASQKDECRAAAQLEKDALRAAVAPDIAVGRAWVHDTRGGAALSRLSRYEGSLERAFYRNLHELQRLQAVRAGAAVPPPLAIDVIHDVALDVKRQNEPGNAASLEPIAA